MQPEDWEVHRSGMWPLLVEISAIVHPVPTWLFLWRQSAATEWSRFAYLPTIGAAWLFGDLCAARGWRLVRLRLIDGVPQ